MLDSVRIADVSKMGFVGAKKVAKSEHLPHAINANALQKDTFQKQNKLNSICALTGGYATPMMV